MIKYLSIFFLCICSFKGIAMLNVNKDSSNTRKYKVAIHHEVLSPVIYPLIIGGDNSRMNVVAWKYFTGGIRYKISQKNEIGVDYLFFEKSVSSKHQGEDVEALFGSIVNSNFSYDAKNHVYQQKYIWLYYRRNFRNFFASCGFGGGLYTYKNNTADNAVSEKNYDWCNVIDLGYNVKIYKNVSISCYLGMLNSFSFKKEIAYDKPIIYSADVIYNYEVEQFKDLKKIEIRNNTVIREYKYLGILQSKIIPRLGISLMVQI